jgi:hypothetical protein
VVEKDAGNYSNWNERILAECYGPNAALGNFQHVSFDFGEALAGWLADHAPDTYRAILAADHTNQTQRSCGNAIPQSYDHVVMPLARREDKAAQVIWAQAAFESRFGRTTEGFWLPEMAVDLETLEVLADHGVQWTVLTASQIEDKPAGAGPFWVELPGGRRITVFVRDEQLSNDIAFRLGHIGGAGRWAREVLLPRKREAGPLTLIATDGETFGHHWPGEEQFLHWLLTYEALAAGYHVVTLAQYARMVKPEQMVRIRENTSWSCFHGLARWVTGCSCTPGDPSWKAALRRALDSLRSELDCQYRDYVGRLGIDPQTFRNRYIDVVLGRVAPGDYAASLGIEIHGEQAENLTRLAEAQYYRQRMLTSCAFLASNLDAHATRYAIAAAAHACHLTYLVTGSDLGASFRRDLSLAKQYSEYSGRVVLGSEIYDAVVSESASADTTA